ncbi:MAG: ribosome silencing factor [Polyangiaceae bacterium]|nr:ribosome silencing factor [Polyangiaceae bacterium]
MVQGRLDASETALTKKPAPPSKPSATKKPAAKKPAEKKPAAKRPAPAASAAPAKKSPATRRPAAPKADGTRTARRGAGPAQPSGRDTSLWVAAAALDKKAVDLEIIDVSGRVDYADFIVLMTGTSDRHVASLVQGIEAELKEQHKLRPLAVEGMPHASWVLVDYGDVVVHVFQAESRALYDVGGLWMDARRLPVPAPSRGQR